MKQKKHEQTASRKQAAVEIHQDRLRGVWFIGLVAILVATPMVPSESAAVSALGLPFVLVWLLLIAGWLWGMAVTRSWRMQLGWSDMAMLIFLGCHSLSALVMAPQGQPRQAHNMLWQWVTLGLCLIVGRNLIRGEGARRAVVSVFIGLASCLATYSFFQYKVSMPAARAEFQTNPDLAVQKMGLHAPPGSSQRKQLEDRVGSTEPYATFSLANSLAGFMTPWLVCAISLSLNILRVPPRSTRVLAAIGLSVVVMILCLVLTKSRTAWLSVIFGIVLVTIYGRRDGWRPDWRMAAVLVGTTVVAVFVALVMGGLDWLVVSESSKSVLYRFQYWRSTAAMIADHFWLGCGPGNFQQYYTQYKLPEASETVSDPHNFILEVWATAGTPAAVAFLAVFAGLIKDTRRQSAVIIGEVSADDPASSACIRNAYLGGALGILLAFPLGLLAGFIPDLAILYTGLPVAVLVVFGLHEWVIRGSLPRFATAIPAVVLLVNLLGAGGISFTGVSQSLWLLIALSTGNAKLPTTARLGSFGFGPLIGIAVPALLLFVFLTTTFFPVQQRETYTQEAVLSLAQHKLAAAEQQYQLAADADPKSDEPLHPLAMISQQVWSMTGDADRKRRFETQLEEMLHRTRRSYQARLLAGGWWLEAFRKFGDSGLIIQAVGHYRESALLYPNSSFVHAQLAWACYLVPQDEKLRAEAIREAKEALRLDLLNPHREQKLENLSLFDVPGQVVLDGQEPTPQTTAAEVMMHILNEKS